VAYYSDPFQLTQFSDHPISTLDYTLTDIQFAPQSVPFDLSTVDDYKHPGTIIQDRTVQEARNSPNHEVSYTVAADGTLLRMSANKVLKRHTLLVFFVVLMVPPVIFAFRAKKRQKN
jgi:hypothetical protein